MFEVCKFLTPSLAPSFQMAEEALECVCLTLPEGEVHQCNEGHCYCVGCWNRLEEPRRCPECRQPIPQANRNRAAERAIAALEASCEHCGEATTRGALAAHINSCPFRPTTCAAAAAGCGWAGMLSEQAAHKAACPFAICQQMMAPLQAQNRELQVRCQELHAQNQVQHSHNQRLQAQCDGLQAQNQQLLQPLAGRVRALEGVETEQGGRRQRQRVGPAPRDMPPSDNVIADMGLADAVAALRAHMAVARVAKKACERLDDLCMPDGGEQATAEAGVIEAVVEALRAHRQVGGVQKSGCHALLGVCRGLDAAAGLRQQRAADAGALEAAVAGMQAHPQVAALQSKLIHTVHMITYSGNAAGEVRRQRAAEAGALEAILVAIRANPSVASIGCNALFSVCYGAPHCAVARARRQRATQANGRMVVAAAMLARPNDEELQRRGQRILGRLAAA